jgi:hypothetical protein
MPKTKYTTITMRGVKEAKDQIMEVIIWYRDYFLKGGSKENVPGFMDLYNLGLTVIEGQKEIKKIFKNLKSKKEKYINCNCLIPVTQR